MNFAFSLFLAIAIIASVVMYISIAVSFFMPKNDGRDVLIMVGIPSTAIAACAFIGLWIILGITA